MARQVSRGETRRSVVRLWPVGAGLIIGRPFLALAAPAKNADDAREQAAKLQPGQFIWRPSLSPDGPVAIIVSIPSQLVFVYRNGVLIGVSTCSTGKPGHETPRGVFTILQKAKVHTSNVYHEAMPDTERLTWQGVALHAGDLPGYPASHGCVHLPLAFAADVFGVTQVGTPVIIAGDHTDPASVRDPGPILGTTAEEEIKAKLGRRAPGPSSAHAVTSILVSRADSRIYVLENGEIVATGDAVIRDPTEPLGSNVFVWRGGDAAGSTWEGMGFHADPNGAVAPQTTVLERIDGSPGVMDAIRERIRPGTVLVTTDLPASAGTRSDTHFTVIDAAPSPHPP